MAQPNLPPDIQVLQLAMGRWVSQALSVAARLNVADLLGDGPMSVTDLSAKTGSHAGALYRILRALATVGVFTETAPGTFSNTLTSDALRTGAPNSMRKIAMMFNDPWNYGNWGHLDECVQTGKSVPEVTGVNLFDQIAADAQALATFHGAMSDMSRGASGAVLAAYDFADVTTLADIAGGHGLLLTDVLRAKSALKGMLFERPEVIRGAQTGPYVKGLESRMTLMGGDFFKAIPAGADAYMMKHILHDWSDELCTTILRNIRAVVPATGKLLLVEFVIPAGNEPHPGKWIDLEMLVNPGGKERTAHEWETLLASGGFRLNRIVPTHSPFSVIEGAPA